MTYKNPNLVINNPQIFLNLKFNLNFISDDEMRKHLKERYAFEECVYIKDSAMQLVLQHVADDISDYYNKIYELSTLEYNALHNVDATVEFTDTTDKESVAESKDEAVNSGYPNENNSPKKANRTDSENNSKIKDNTVMSHSERRFGNIGVTSSAQLLTGEAELAKTLRRIIEKYTEEFSDCFMLSI